MRKIPRVTYLTPDELDEVIAVREAEATTLPDGSAKQSVLKEVAQLRVYSAAKRWGASPAVKPTRRLAC